MHIYSVISITQLKSSTTIITKISDSYKKVINTEFSFIYNKNDYENDESKIEKIIDKKIFRNKSHYLIQ